jgi:hypothetical protein
MFVRVVKTSVDSNRILRDSEAELFKSHKTMTNRIHIRTRTQNVSSENSEVIIRSCSISVFVWVTQPLKNVSMTTCIYQAQHTTARLAAQFHCPLSQVYLLDKNFRR